MIPNHPTAKNSIASRTLDQYINGPHWEPLTIPNATTYWGCSSCGRESTRERDLYRTVFHAPDCEVHEC